MGQTLTLWRMNGRSVVDQVGLTSAVTPTAADVAEFLSKTDWPTAPVYACGLTDAPVAMTPAKSVELAVQPSTYGDVDVLSVHCIAQAKPVGRLDSAACQINGFLSLNPGWDGVICIVQERSFWVMVSANEVVSFDSTLTPKLAHAMGAQDTVDTKVLQDALQDGLSRPEALASRLSSVQWSADASALKDSDAASQTWGVLLGAELAATRPYWLGQNLALIADPAKSAIYQSAFDSQFLPVTVTSAEQMVLAGLAAARHRHLRGQSPLSRSRDCPNGSCS
ncbi:2-dehydro-3-deoxygalactonokinase [Epibacterium ulvae]|uniref:2-dehydro-3-deoxygalactonokinase n=1 Tax=Epibacterium ulvae TaxID=1156985 RepID=UPI001BFC2B6F|nr:2-dehydro-3-deoxygalactonokinase [Epibacterium ulvae]MBT8153963.1 2-dehydro-3-deoxygalactonokinase [Epibacterium ulvae]